MLLDRGRGPDIIATTIDELHGCTTQRSNVLAKCLRTLAYSLDSFALYDSFLDRLRCVKDML